MTARLTILILCMAVVLCVAPYSKARPDSFTRFDEFGALNRGDLGARLDNFAIQLQYTPDSTGYVISYGPDIEGPGSGKSVLLLMKDYLVNTRGLPSRRIKTIYGGRNQELTEPKTVLWIVPKGGSRPLTAKYDTEIDTFKGLFSKDEVEDSIEIEVPDEMGPGISRPIHASFADMLQQQKKAIGYVVTYNGEISAPGAAQRLAANELDHLKQYKVDAKRLRTIFGGTRKKSMVELWIMSPNDPPPVENAGSEIPLEKNVQLIAISDDNLATTGNERAVFNRLQEVLRANPALQACVIVSLEVPEPGAEPNLHPEPPRADLPKLVEKWRQELTNTHKIPPERFTVLFTTNGPVLGGNYLALWIVPPGQPLPDPSADPSEVVKDPERRP